MSTVTEIESAIKSLPEVQRDELICSSIESLPKKERETLLLHIAEKWEDYQDMQAALAALSEGVFLPLQEVLNKCDAIHGFSKQQG